MYSLNKEALVLCVLALFITSQYAKTENDVIRKELTSEANGVSQVVEKNKTLSKEEKLNILPEQLNNTMVTGEMINQLVLDSYDITIMVYDGESEILNLGNLYVNPEGFAELTIDVPDIYLDVQPNLNKNKDLIMVDSKQFYFARNVINTETNEFVGAYFVPVNK